MINKEALQQALDELHDGKATHEEKMAYLEELNQGIDGVHIILDDIKANQIKKQISQTL